MFSKSVMLISLISAASLTACGGGGDSATAGSQTEMVPTLSTTQKTFEETTLATNGGTFSVVTYWASSGANLATTAAYLAEINLSKSPLGVAQGVLATLPLTVDLIAALPTPNNFSEVNLNVGTAFIDNGQLAFVSTRTPANYTYSGDNIIEETKSNSGQVGSKILITGFTKVALSGIIADTPTEVQDLNRPLATYISNTQTYQVGAAYYKRVGTRIGDRLVVQDSDSNPATDPKSATALFFGTIEEYAASAGPSVIILAKGTIKIVKGARCWVNNAASAANGTAGTAYNFSNFQFG